MAMQTLKLLLCFMLIFPFDAYRVHSKGKVETRGRSRSKATFHRVTALEGTESNETIFVAASMLGAFAGTLAVAPVAPATVAAASGAATLVSNCAPSLAVMTPALVTGSAAGPLAAVVAPLAIIAVLALIGAIVLTVKINTLIAIALAFCPVSNFAQEPMQALVSSQPYLAFPEDLENAFEEGLDGGMPECHAMKAVELKQTRCTGTDRACMEKACRTKCCEDEDCTFYQFEMEDTGNGAKNVVCHLGEKHMLTDKNCEKPFFGEVCLARMPAWPQKGGDHTKCVSGYSIGEGFQVDDQLDCQNVAVENGHCYYQYNEKKKTCATCKDLSDTVKNTVDNWKVYGDPNCGKDHADVTVPCTDWQFKPLLLTKVKKTKLVRPGARGCRGNSAACLKKRCRIACNEAKSCKFYQFQEGVNQCYLGSDETLGDDSVVEAWHGGFVSSERQCKTGYQCPSTSACVDDCSACSGYEVNGAEKRGRGKNKGKWCLRSAVQGLCFEGNWKKTYQNVPVDQWCKNMEKVTVKLNTTLGDYETGESVCKQACCSDPDCSLYQMDEKDAKKKGSELTKGTKLECFLGMETAGGKPKFKCTGKQQKRWRKSSQPVGKALDKRGCTDGSIACLTTKKCVDHCRSECMGAEIHNTKEGVCESPSSVEEENIEQKDNPRKKLGFKSNLVSSFPALSKSKETDDSYYLDPKDESDFSTQDQLLSVQLHSRKVASASKKIDMSTACQSLKDNDDSDEWLCWYEDDACVCEFDKKQQCKTWFADGKHLKTLVEDVGMVLFPGDKCSCDDKPSDGMYLCKFGIKDELPKIRPVKGSDAQLSLAGTKKASCPRTTIPGYDDCNPVHFGDHACGYECKKGGEEYWCAHVKNEWKCHKQMEEDSKLCSKDETCGMSSCKIIDYGTYGCGYGCHNDAGDFFYCTQDCECGAS